MREIEDKLSGMLKKTTAALLCHALATVVAFSEGMESHGRLTAAECLDFCRDMAKSVGVTNEEWNRALSQTRATVAMVDRVCNTQGGDA